MADPATRSPMAGVAMPDAPGVTVRDATGRTMWRTWRESAAMGRIVSVDGGMEFSTSPGELTIVSEGPVPEDCVDLTHVRATIGIEGPLAAELIMRLTPLDLTDDMFVPGSAARTLVAGITTEILRESEETYSLLVSRSFARSMLEAITRAAETLEAD